MRTLLVAALLLVHVAIAADWNLWQSVQRMQRDLALSLPYSRAATILAVDTFSTVFEGGKNFSTAVWNTILMDRVLNQSQIRRLERVPLYWYESDQTWRLCPRAIDEEVTRTAALKRPTTWNVLQDELTAKQQVCSKSVRSLSQLLLLLEEKWFKENSSPFYSDALILVLQLQRSLDEPYNRTNPIHNMTLPYFDHNGKRVGFLLDGLDSSLLKRLFRPQRQVHEDPWNNEAYSWPSWQKCRNQLILGVEVSRSHNNAILYNATREESAFLFPASALRSRLPVLQDAFHFLSTQTEGSFYQQWNASFAWESCADASCITTAVHEGESVLLTQFPQQDEALYSFLSSATWSWAPDEPRNVTSTANSQSINLLRPGASLTPPGRCAVINLKTGRWQPDNCITALRGACRDKNKPFVWYLTAQRTGYDGVNCPDNTEFSVPRTALENDSLLHWMRHWMQSKANENNGDLIRLDLNDWHSNGCWVTGGVNARCPYDSRPTRQMLVIITLSALGGGLLLMFGACFLIYKWRRYRQLRKFNARRKLVLQRNAILDAPRLPS